jgi:hypothetical protein
VDMMVDGEAHGPSVRTFTRRLGACHVRDPHLLPAPVIRLDHPTRQHRPCRLQPLPDNDQTELVEACERGQVRPREGSFRHVEVFRTVV